MVPEVLIATTEFSIFLLGATKLIKIGIAPRYQLFSKSFSLNNSTVPVVNLKTYQCISESISNFRIARCQQNYKTAIKPAKPKERKNLNKKAKTKLFGNVFYTGILPNISVILLF